MAIITLANMRFYANHGCFDEERAIGTNFRVDLSFDVDTERAQQSDNIEDTVNYLSVYQVVSREMKTPSHLLEHVADRIGKSLLLEFSDMVSNTVKVSKLNPPLGGQLESVSVEITSVRCPQN